MTHLCTDPQHLCPEGVQGTPDGLPFSGASGVGQWVADNWIGRPGSIVEGCKAIHAIGRWRQQNTGDLPIDLIVYPNERLRHLDRTGQIALDTQVENMIDQCGELLAPLIQLWAPTGPSSWAPVKS